MWKAVEFGDIDPVRRSLRDLPCRSVKMKFDRRTAIFLKRLLMAAIQKNAKVRRITVREEAPFVIKNGAVFIDIPMIKQASLKKESE